MLVVLIRLIMRDAQVGMKIRRAMFLTHLRVSVVTMMMEFVHQVVRDTTTKIVV